MPITPPTLSEVIGRRVRSIREDHDLTQHDAALLFRQYGLSLTQSAVAGIESGSRAVAIGELVIIAGALQVPVADLLAGDGPVQLTTARAADLAAVRSFLAGRGELPDPVAVALRQAFRAAQRTVDRYYPGARSATIVAAERAGDLAAEQKAARSLGIPPVAVSLVAFRLWGMSLTAKRDAEVDERTTPDTPARSVQAIRGRVTRDLLVEIRAAVKAK
jgi:transcriptional regulator with XRE-family HTH domain